MKVICINDKDLPTGANILKDKEYEILDRFINFADQTVYTLKGVNNKGTTKFGLPWIGYRADRFKIIDNNDSVELKEETYMYN